MSRRVEIREQQTYLEARYPIKLDSDYSFIREDFGYLILSKLVYFFVIIFGRSFFKMIGTHKAIGKDNVKNIDGIGFISISNHCHFLDSVLTGTSLRNRTIWFSSMQRNFETPYVRHILRILKGFPIPNNPFGLMQIMKPVVKTIKRGNVVHFYPESEMWHMHLGIGNFQQGAFYLAHKANCPVLPIVHLFKPRTFFGIIVSKNILNVTTIIGEPIYADSPCINDNDYVNTASVKVMAEKAHNWMLVKMTKYKNENNID
jgi:1-acyl-sn-glycerol-3-phosphate acyltransferase